jgi:hypothetical protein
MVLARLRPRGGRPRRGDVLQRAQSELTRALQGSTERKGNEGGGMTAMHAGQADVTFV